MTSSQGATSYDFWSSGPEIAEVEKVFPVSRLRVSRQQESQRSFDRHALRCERHDRRRVWSDSGQWSVSGQSWSVLVVLLAVMCQSLTAAADKRAAGTCQARLGDTVIDIASVR